MKKLIVVNFCFALLLLVFLLAPITSNWAWLGLMTAWFLAETWLSRDTSILWWHWLVVFVTLGSLDYAIIQLMA